MIDPEKEMEREFQHQELRRNIVSTLHVATDDKADYVAIFGEAAKEIYAFVLQKVEKWEQRESFDPLVRTHILPPIEQFTKSVAERDLLLLQVADELIVSVKAAVQSRYNAERMGFAKK